MTEITSSIGIGFPGQGVHEPVNMNRLLDEYPEAAALVRDAEDILEENLEYLLRDASQPEHTSRESQLRSYLGSSALWMVANSRGIIPDDARRIFFGASAGETAAMSAAGFYSFETGLYIAESRGDEMHKASIINPGEMLVASGLPFKEGEELAKDIPGLYAVNDNPGVQTVFSGTRVAIATAAEKLSGTKVNLHLPDIKEAAHTWHMGPAATGLKRTIKKARWSRPQYDFMGNQAKMLDSVSKARRHFTAQLTRGVLLTKSADEMYYNHGVRTFVDVGQGKVLYGQMKRQFRHMKGDDSVELISVVDELLQEKL
jgi:malonyl CoA-acyl carrier protein transacylase